jgi:hypothetical protein
LRAEPGIGLPRKTRRFRRSRHEAGVAPGNANSPGSRPETVGQGDNMMQSTIENMPPRE